MQLSNIGIIANLMWYEIKNHAKDCQLGEFVVMPDHVHGILILNKDELSNESPKVETRHALSLPLAIETDPIETGPENLSPAQSRFQNQGKGTISSIVGSYKSVVTKHAHRLGFEFAWQARFHDHIIRNENEFEKISKYIRRNPENYDNEDSFDTFRIG